MSEFSPKKVGEDSKTFQNEGTIDPHPFYISKVVHFQLFVILRHNCDHNIYNLNQWPNQLSVTHWDVYNRHFSLSQSYGHFFFYLVEILDKSYDFLAWYIWLLCIYTYRNVDIIWPSSQQYRLCDIELLDPDGHFSLKYKANDIRINYSLCLCIPNKHIAL